MPEPEKLASQHHRLAAIMFTDVVSYTSMMQADEARALRTIERHRAVLESCTQNYKGEVLQYYGDGSLSLFPSALEAVQCALEIQQELTQDPIVPLRIGIHLGDVKMQGHSLFGDGVNLAARVESLGVAGAILISDAVYYQVRNKPGIQAIPLGSFHLKNVDHPVPVFALAADFLAVPNTGELPGRIRAVSNNRIWAIAFLAVLILAVTAMVFLNQTDEGPMDKSIAVLPFENRSNDPEQEYFSDGITDDITNHLVKVPQLRVKSRTSTEQYKNPDKTIPVIGRELGVSYILEGSVRKEGNQVRIVAQLIDAEHDVQIWTESFDREITEIFDIQSEIALEIAQVLEARLTSEERGYIRGGPDGRGPPSDISAYDFLLRARANWRNWNDEEDLLNALRWVNEAIRKDPSYARAYVLKGQILHFGMRNYGVPTQVWIDEALEMVGRAIGLDSTLADAYLLKGRILSLQDEGSELAQQNLQKAYDLEPGNPDVFRSLGWTYLVRGEYEQGIDLIIQSIESGYSTQDPEYFMRWGDLYFQLGRDFEKAEEFYQEANERAPGWIDPHYHLAQLYRYWGKYDLAEKSLTKALDIAPLDQESLDLMGWVQLMKANPDSAAVYWSKYPELERKFADTTQYVPFRHRLAYVRFLQGDTVTAKRLVREQLRLDHERRKNLRGYGVWISRGYYYDLAISHALLSEQKEALNWLDSAFQKGFVNVWYLQNDPPLRAIRHTPRFQDIENELAERELKRKEAFDQVLRSRGIP